MAFPNTFCTIVNLFVLSLLKRTHQLIHLTISCFAHSMPLHFLWSRRLFQHCFRCARPSPVPTISCCWFPSFDPTSGLRSGVTCSTIRSYFLEKLSHSLQVILPYPSFSYHRWSLCFSSQPGCPVLMPILQGAIPPTVFWKIRPGSETSLRQLRPRRSTYNFSFTTSSRSRISRIMQRPYGLFC